MKKKMKKLQQVKHKGREKQGGGAQTEWIDEGIGSDIKGRKQAFKKGLL